MPSGTAAQAPRELLDGGERPGGGRTRPSAQAETVVQHQGRSGSGSTV
jgi:hypothetical protein